MQGIIHKIKRFKFKKVHYFDLAVILLILLVISIFLYNRFSKKNTWVDVRVIISDNELWWGGDQPPYWFLNTLQPGQISYNSFGEEVAKIIDVETFSLGELYKQSFVDLKLKVSYDTNKQIYLFSFQPIQKGNPIELTFGSNSVSGLVVSIDSEPEERFSKKILVKVSNLEEWMAKSYAVGMEMKDSKGRTLAKIESVRLENSKLVKVELIDNTLYQNTGNFKDLYMEISLTALKDDEGFYRFVNGAPIKIGDEIWFHFPEIVARATTVKIIE